MRGLPGDRSVKLGRFRVVVVALLAFDLGVLHRKEREIGIAESLKLSAFYICAGLGFGAYIWLSRGPKDGLDYYTGFLVEKNRYRWITCL